MLLKDYAIYLYYISQFPKESFHLLFVSGRMEGHVIYSHMYKKKIAIHIGFINLNLE